MKYTTHNLEETYFVAKELAEALERAEDRATVVGLYGELGAGKTAFVQGLAKAFGLVETTASPTFVIEKIYDLPSQNQDGRNNRFSKLIHIDAYRLEHSNELLHLGWEKINSDRDNLIVVEWPERVSDIMPGHIVIKLSHVSECVREIDITE